MEITTDFLKVMEGVGTGLIMLFFIVIIVAIVGLICGIGEEKKKK
jgi:hypothetical protein